jgi:hypothetical protein
VWEIVILQGSLLYKKFPAKEKNVYERNNECRKPGLGILLPPALEIMEKETKTEWE